MGLRVAVYALMAAAGLACAQGDAPPLLSCAGEVSGVSRLEWAPGSEALVQRLASGERVRVSVALCGRGAADVELESFELLTEDAELVDGSTGRAVARPDVLLLRADGLDEQSGSYLAIDRTVLPWRAQGWLGVRNAEGRAERWLVSGDAETGMVAYDARGMAAAGLAISIPPCGVGAEQVVGLEGTAGSGGSGGDGGFSPRVLSCREATIAIESDYEYVSLVFGGNTTAASAYALTLFGATSELYRQQLNVSFRVPFVRVWSQNDDPYADGSDVNARLTELRNVWMATMGTTSRTVVHMLTGKSAGAGGIAYRPGACGAFGYGVSGYLNGSFPNPLVTRSWQNWDVVVLSHELGHNFGARHTHEMEPVIDGCGIGDCSLAAAGTIMSYCHTCSGGLANIDLSFAPRTISEDMDPFLASAGCTAVQPVAITAQPPAVWSLGAGQNTAIQVSASGTRAEYQWFKNGQPIAGATARRLEFQPCTTADSGTYFCRVRNACSSVQSNASVFTVLPRCDSLDFNRDGGIDPGDVDAYFSVLGEGPCLQ
jgi:hypothetical protein